MAAADLPGTARGLQLLPRVLGLPRARAQAPRSGPRPRGHRLGRRARDARGERSTGSARAAPSGSQLATARDGSGGLRRAGDDPRRTRREDLPPAAGGSKRVVVRSHGGMLGSYIAAVSAFSVVNFTFLPPTVRWLWPTAIGTPLIAVWVTVYKIRFRRGASARVETVS